MPVLQVASDATEVRLRGYNARDRFDDDEVTKLAQLTRLETLVLRDQNITRIPRGLAAVKHLELIGNKQLASLAGIEEMVGLQSISLDLTSDLDRAITQLAELPELVDVELHCATVPAHLAKLRSLLRLTLTGLAELDLKRIAPIATLRQLELEVPEPVSFAKLAQIEKLTITSGVLPPSVFEMPQLRVLVARRNKRITSIPKTIGKATKLEILDLKETAVRELPAAIGSCKALQVLDLDFTPIRELPESITTLQNLRELGVYAYLPGRRVKALPASIGQLSALRVLRLPTQLTDVPESFWKLTLEALQGAPALVGKVNLIAPSTPETDHLVLDDPERIPADFGNPRTLVLALPGVERDLPQLSNLTALETAVIDIGNLGAALRRLASARELRVLRLEDPEIPDEVCLLDQITELALRTVSRLPASLAGCRALRELRMWSDERVDLRVLATLPALRELDIDLQRTQCEALLDALAKTPIEKLVLQCSRLTELPASIGKLAHLQKLSLANTKVWALPPTIAALTELRWITAPGIEKQKALLPPGRWKKCSNSASLWYERD